MTTDIRFALRTLARTPWLTAVATVCLAVAIGLTTAVFSVVQSVLFSPLPLPGGDRLVMVQDFKRIGRHNLPVSASDFTTRRERAQSFDDLAAWYSRNVTLDFGSGQATVVRAAYVSPNALALAGIAPAFGRLPADVDVEPGAAPVVLLAHHVWHNRFGGEDWRERSIEIGGRPHRLIGVLPGGVRFPIREDAWIPVQTDARAVNATPESLTLFGRLKTGVSRQQAAAELSTLTPAPPSGDPREAMTSVVMPFARGFLSTEGELAMYGLLAALVLFLVVIASNLANLFFARNSARLREVAVRAAIGAGRWQLMRPFLIETVLLSVVAAGAGLAVARAMVRWFLANGPDIPWWADFSLNVTLFGVLAAATLVAGAAAGIGPARRLTRGSTRGSTMDVLKASGTAGLRFSRAGAVLLVGQLAVSVGCLSVVAVLAQAMFGFSFQRYGLAGDAVLVAQVYMGQPPEAELAGAGTNRRDVWLRHFARSQEQFDRVRAALAARPGIVSATYSTHFPGNDVATATIDYRPSPESTARTSTRIAEVGPDFFLTLGAGVVL